jgi:hypothetical protein
VARVQPRVTRRTRPRSRDVQSREFAQELPRALNIELVASWLLLPSLDAVKTGVAGQGATQLLYHGLSVNVHGNRVDPSVLYIIYFILYTTMGRLFIYWFAL